ncbi:hypothetical protein DXG01_013171 [Tephrocybe rancida]|nr:hypothetical protein DXG01_013171 [Tephrocybe rancida]
MKVQDLIGRLADEEEYKKLLACHGPQAQEFLDVFLSNFMDNPPQKFQHKLITVMPNVAGQAHVRLAYSDLGDWTVQDTSEDSGRHADVFKGKVQGQDVCFKAIRRTQHTNLEDWWKAILHEATVWDSLGHPNILPFYGICHFRNTIAFVSPWMDNRNICTFLEKNTDSNRVIFAYDVAQALKFLHANGVIHSDLKGRNLLINKFGRICLADFGSAYPSSLGFTCGTVRWQAPENFDPEAEEVLYPTKESDIYSWAGVAYEIFVGEVPFAKIARDITIMYKVLRGQRPSRPAAESLSWSVWGLTEGIWQLMEECWSADPANRPTIDMIIEELEIALPSGVEKEARHADYLLPEQFRELTRAGKEKLEVSVGVLQGLLD